MKSTGNRRPTMDPFVTTVVMALVLTGLLVSASPAFAEPGDVDASECLSGDAGPRDLVAESGFGWFRSISLYCGDITRGVVHIAQSHPINEDGADGDDIVTCLGAVLENGEEKEAASSRNESYEAKRSDGGAATVVWDRETDEVVTIHTSDPGGNNWSACAEFVGG